MHSSDEAARVDPPHDQSDDALLSRPVIVIGAAGRTGTGTLTEYISQHPSLSFLNEPRVVWRWGNESKSDMFRRSDARPEVKRYIRENFAEHVRKEGKQRLIEKTPSNSLRMEFVNEIFPDCQFVHIMRDGRDAVLSIYDFWQRFSTGIKEVPLRKRLREAQPSQLPYYGRELVRRLLPHFLGKRSIWGPRIPGIDGLLRDLDVLDVACLQWRTCIEAACQFGRTLPSERYLEIRLEDFSHETLSQVLAFCGLSDDPAVHELFRARFEPQRTGARRAQASPEVLERIDFWILPTQRWLGYV